MMPFCSSKLGGSHSIKKYLENTTRVLDEEASDGGPDGAIKFKTRN